MERHVLGHAIPNIVEDVELRFGSKERRVGDTRRCQVLLGLLRHLTRVFGIDLSGARIVDIENHDERALTSEWVDVCGADIGNQLHIRFVNACEASDRGAVEELPRREEVLIDCGRGNVEVLLNTRKIRETDVDELDVRFLDESEDFGRGTEHVGHSRCLTLR